MTDVRRWTLFALLSPEFVDNIQCCVVFGNAGSEAVILTKNDEVFGIGTNCCSCLGLGNGQGSLEPIKIEPLSGREIVSFSFGSGPHVLALTRSGQVFAWGHNGYGQLGMGNTNPGIAPVQVVHNLNGHRVIQISCGSHHSAVVTDRGEVFAWGQNSNGQIGNNNNVNQHQPRRVGGLIHNRFIKAVACGQNCTMAVTTSGELYSWGYNGNGQLGVGNLANQQTPCRVLELQNVVLSQIACGFAHSLALSDEGELFAWGSNSCGQLGFASRSNQPIPMRTAMELGRIVEIAAVHACNITAALIQSGKVFMWGQVRGQSIGIPIETRFTMTDDVFACFACPSVAWRPIVFATEQRNAIQDSIRVAFDDPTTADVRISIDGRSIHAHKAILKIRCQHFRSMFRDLWPEGNGANVEITQFPYSVYRSFLSWLYTDELDVETEDAVGLLDLANCYCESALKEKCAQIIRKGITVDNSALLYAAALRFEAKDLEEYCFQFCLNHMTAVAQTESFGRLDECSIKHFVTEAAKHGAFKH